MVINALKGVFKEIIVSPRLLNKINIISVVAVNYILNILAIVLEDKEVED
jgi:hypothetical protein